MMDRRSKAVSQYKRYLPLIKELVGRDLKVKYRRSALGYVWSILNPLLMMVLQGIIFSYMFRYKIDNFLLYLICGNTMMTFLNEATSTGMVSILANGPLLRKVYVPKYIFPVSRVVSAFVNMIFSLAATVIVMIFTGAHFYWTLLLFWIPMVLLFFFAAGIAMFLSAFVVYFRDVQYIYSVVIQAWTYATPLFYPIEALPPAIIPIMKWNPMYQYITFFRQLVMYGELPSMTTVLACIVCAVLSVAIGIAVFRKLQRNFIMHI